MKTKKNKKEPKKTSGPAARPILEFMYLSEIEGEELIISTLSLQYDDDEGLV